MARPTAIRLQFSIPGFEDAVEKEMIDPNMIVEIFHMAKRMHGTSDMGMQLRRTVRRQGHVKCVAQSRHLEKAGIAPASRHIRLKTIDGSGCKHTTKIIERVAVFAGGDVHSRRDRSRSRRRLSRSSDERGSSNQMTLLSWANRSAITSACLRVYAPLASTKSSTVSPTAFLAARTRDGSAWASRPTFILTRGMPSPAQSPNCSASRFLV